MKPVVICFEGLDHAGKGTAIQATKEHLASMEMESEVIEMIGHARIRDMIKHDRDLNNFQRILLLRAAFVETSAKIDAALSKGKHVLLDRGPASFIAYNGYGPDMVSDNGAVTDINRILVQKVLDTFPIDITPDLIIWLDSDYNTFLERNRAANGTHDAVESSLEMAHKSVNYGFKDVLLSRKDEFFKEDCQVVSVDATQKLKVVLNQVCLGVDFFLEGRD